MGKVGTNPWREYHRRRLRFGVWILLITATISLVVGLYGLSDASSDCGGETMSADDRCLDTADGGEELITPSDFPPVPDPSVDVAALAPGDKIPMISFPDVGRTMDEQAAANRESAEALFWIGLAIWSVAACYGLWRLARWGRPARI
ncbi:hypothetical protein V1Y59_22525 [Gordonia sp. PKS22-38]|uniref:Transmembrane protein n=1 Tax=Gordonia prachuapensis TaxID=3115651 RepID=A0ABU7N0Y6_9ACTN|nr:hypothetical protein [Gordonia sp. PKS22-38]